MRFSWQAQDAEGKTSKGMLEAENAREVRQWLRSQGLFPQSINEKKSLSYGNPLVTKRRVKISGGELALFTRQLATLTSAALPLEESLAVIARQNSNARFATIIRDIRERVTEGHSLSHALMGYSKIFDTIYCTLVKAGEQSGLLGTVLEKLADYNEIRQQMRSKLTQALIYPVMLSSVAIIVVTILLTTVVPKVVEQFIHMKQQLPLSTRTLLAISDALRNQGPWALALVALLSTAYVFWLKKPSNRHLIHKKLMSVFPGHILICTINSARYVRTLSILQSSGVPLLDSMTIAAEGITNLEIRQRLFDAADRVRQGSGFHASLERANLFPPMMLYMIASGEKSGQLSALMERAADNQDKLLQNRIAIALALFEPALIITMACVVLFIVVSVLQPILQLNTLVS
ncbi:type II secretion system inner membrane protein GspF [Buttiauxella gaviniae]|uniref:General secretion pathway protein F n=1 Tax=Buttiauxella gaviniae TaxID=82990 RepID=A0ABV3NSV9_9ENTR